MPSTPQECPSRRRWVILLLGVLGQASACSFIYGVPFLVPLLRDDLNLSLAAVAVYVAAPTTGLVLTLVLWGAAADRFGERKIMVSGLLVEAGVVGLVSVLSQPSPVVVFILFALGGAGGASVFAASGRMIMGWFPRSERGLAMGLRQTSQPVGVALAGFALPSLALLIGTLGSLAYPAGFCLLAALLIAAFAPDAPRPQTAPGGRPPGSPYRTPLLWRVHGASALLVVPQFAISAFTAEYLVREQGWGSAAAGAFVAVMQLAGAGSRVGSGIWSDRVGSRLRPMRQVAMGAAAVLVLFAVGHLAAGWLAVVALGLGGIVTVASNGLSYTSIAEIAGSAWSGRALGVQNTGQNIVSTITPVALGAAIGAGGYAVGFLLAGLAPVAAALVTPVRHEPEPRW